MHRMGVNFGGAGPKMHDTVISDSPNDLGPHNPTLQPNDTQRMYFVVTDEGPFWMKPDERLRRKYDRETGKIVKKPKNCHELKKELLEKGVKLDHKRYLAKDLKKLAKDNNIPVDIMKPEVVEGWVGKSKGLKQILWERGLLDPNKQLKDTSNA